MPTEKPATKQHVEYHRRVVLGRKDKLSMGWQPVIGNGLEKMEQRCVQAILTTVNKPVTGLPTTKMAKYIK